MIKRILLAATLLLSSSAYAAISGTKVYGVGGTVANGGWPATVDLTGHTPTSGNILVVCQTRNDDAIGLSATTPSGFTAGPTYSDGSAGALSGASFWKKAGGAESSISVTWSDTSQGGSYTYVELPGTDLDVDALGDSGENETNIASATASLSSGSATNSTATGLAIACLSTNNGVDNDVTAWSNGFGEQQETNYASTARGETFLATKVLSSAAAQSTAGTITSDQGYGSILVFNASGATCPATCVDGPSGPRSARCITDISDASDADNILYGLSPAATANEDTVCYDPSSVLDDTVNVTAAGWPSIASGGSQLTDSFDYCIMDNGDPCGTDGTYEVTFQPVITSVTGIGTGQTTGTVTVTPAGPTEGTVRGVAILKSVYDLYGAPSHAQIAAGVDANYDGVSWGSEFTSDLATPDVWTNLLTRSNDINHGSWALNGSAAKTPNAAVSPSGDSDAVLVDVTSGTSWVVQDSITFTAVPHTYSIWARSVSGSGTYTLNWNDGSHHRQHVNLTTAWQRFSITFTPSATSNGFIYLADNRLAADLTQAYVWHPQLEAASTAGPYTPTTADARARFDGYTFSRASSQTYEKSDGTLGTVTSGNPAFTYSGGTAQGVLLERSRTNLALYSDDLSNAVWVATDITKGSTSTTGIYGSAITTVEATASAANGTLLQTVTASSAAYTYSTYLKRKTGTGNIDITVNGGTGWTTCTVTASWSPCSVTATVTNPQIGIRIVTSGDAVYAQGSMVEAGSFRSSAIYTTTGSANRVATSLTRNWTFDTNTFSGYLQAYPGFASTETSATNPVFSAYKDANNYLTITHPTTSGRMDLNLAIGGTTATAQVTGLTWAAGDKLDIRFRKNASGIKLWVEAGSTETTTGVAPNAFTTPPDTVRLGRDESSNYGFWTVGSAQLWNSVDDTALGALN